MIKYVLLFLCVTLCAFGEDKSDVKTYSDESLSIVVPLTAKVSKAADESYVILLSEKEVCTLLVLPFTAMLDDGAMACEKTQSEIAGMLGKTVTEGANSMTFKHVSDSVAYEVQDSKLHAFSYVIVADVDGKKGERHTTLGYSRIHGKNMLITHVGESVEKQVDKMLSVLSSLKFAD